MGHRCKAQKLYLSDGSNIHDDDLGDGSNEFVVADLDHGTPTIEPKISLHAIVCSPTPQTMRIQGIIGKVRVVVLLDLRSTHNFLDPTIACKVGLPVQSRGQFQVTFANGERVLG